jgi:preprotein translocase subunit Sss1
MAKLQEQIVEKYLAALAESGEIDSEKIDQIRKILMRDKRPKPEEFVRIFTAPIGGEIK